MVQQIIAEAFGMAGIGRVSYGCVQNSNACLGTSLEGFVLFVSATVRVDLQQAFDEEDEVSVPISMGGKIRPLAKIVHMVQVGIEKGEIGDRAGVLGELETISI